MLAILGTIFFLGIFIFLSIVCSNWAYHFDSKDEISIPSYGVSGFWLFEIIVSVIDYIGNKLPYPVKESHSHIISGYFMVNSRFFIRCTNFYDNRKMN